MDSHQPADPWGITEVQDDDADGVVATAPREPDSGPSGDDDAEHDEVVTAAVEPVEVPEEFEPPVDETPDETPVSLDEVDETPDEEAQDEESVPVTEEAVWTADSVVAEATELIAAASEEAVVDEPVADESPKFDLGLDEDTSGTWGEEAQSFETGTAFDLIPPSAEVDETPQYEIEEPELSEAFVATSPEGRPDVAMPHLADPDPLMAVPEESMPEPVSDPEPEESSSFRLPGLFGRRKVGDNATAVDEPSEEPVSEETDEAATDETPEPAVEVAEPVVVETPEQIAAEELVDEPVQDTPPVPAAWGAVPEATADPHSPFNGHAVTEVTPEEPSIEEATDEPETPVLDEETDEEAPADEVETPESVEDELDVAEQAEPVAEMEPEAVVDDESVEDLGENVVELPVVSAVTDPEGEDSMEIELTEPDLSELEDQEDLYVTEDTHDDRPPALLTVDSVPGATIAQAVDVVTAVASASNENEIAGAMDRVLGQLRDKAHTLGGEAVISVHTEVQEMGGGFLVTGSGTAVTLA